MTLNLMTLVIKEENEMMNQRKRATLANLVLVGFLGISGHANGTIIGGSVTSGSGTFVKLVPGFTDSDPDNTVGDDTFQNTNLYAFDEDQNVTVQGSALNVNFLASTGTSGSLPIGTVVASHYIFFDPAGLASQEGTVEFDSDVLALITSTGNLLDSDYLANTGVTYLNPALRGLEAGDSVVVSAARQISVDWAARTPGDYVRVLTTFSPGGDGQVPSPTTLILLTTGLAGIGFKRRKPIITL